METITITGNYFYPSTLFLFHKPTNTIAIVNNSTCTADAMKMFAENVKLIYDGIFLSNCKQLYKECKSHLKILNTAGIQ